MTCIARQPRRRVDVCLRLWQLIGYVTGLYNHRTVLRCNRHTMCVRQCREKGVAVCAIYGVWIWNLQPIWLWCVCSSTACSGYWRIHSNTYTYMRANDGRSVFGHRAHRPRQISHIVWAHTRPKSMAGNWQLIITSCARGIERMHAYTDFAYHMLPLCNAITISSDRHVLSLHNIAAILPTIPLHALQQRTCGRLHMDILISHGIVQHSHSR